jgi:CubicO group peptidase (beta-lactamase class C family)
MSDQAESSFTDALEGEEPSPVLVPVELLIATMAKTLCSAVYVSRRQPEEAFRNSTPWSLQAHMLPKVTSRHATWSIDRAARRVDVRLSIDAAIAAELIAAHRALSGNLDADWAAEEQRLIGLGTVRRSAIFKDDQGALIVPANGELTIGFTPTRMPRGPLASASWKGSVSTAAGVQEVIDGAFSDQSACHAAWLVVQHGVIVGERYAPDLDADQPLESWSMGKSVMATLTGLLVGRGALDLDAPAPVSAWRNADDPRSQITLRHLLNMSSGLQCVSQEDPRSTWRYGLPDHFVPYATAVDVEKFAIHRPAEYSPGRVGRYRNCDPLALAVIFDETVRKLGGNPLTFPQTELYDRLGMHGLVHETDRRGRFVISGFNYGCARDWARLAMLYLQDGMWNGQRVLPEGWAQFVQTPAPAWNNGAYGGLFWINATGDHDLPADTFYMAGGGGQNVFLVPSLDLVIVRMGHARGGAVAKEKINTVLRGLCAELAAAR